MKRKRYTYNDVKNIVNDEGYILISKKEDIENEYGFVPTKTKIIIWCGNESHKYSIKELNAFIRGGRCRECMIEKNIIWTKEKIIDFINNNNSIFIDFIYYKQSNSRVLVWCGNPNHKPYEILFYNFYSGKRCPFCKSEHLSETFRYDLNFVKNIIDSNGLEWIDGTYKNLKSKLTVRCKDEKHVYKTLFSCIVGGYGCPHCYGNAKLLYPHVKKYIESFNCKLLSNEYINSNEKLQIQCDKKHIFNITWNKFQQGQRCPYCNMSSGEQEIARILNKYNIDYDIQYNLYGCRDIHLLPFDFIVYIDNVYIMIEFDGEQHFKLGYRNESIDDFVKRKIHDGLKNEYCYFNNIPLIRIPYWQFNNIEEILIKELNLK